MKMKKLLSLLLCVFMVVALTACGDSSSKDSGSTSDVIKVGLLASDTGSTSITEQYFKNSAMMAVEEVNAKGGVNGKKIELIHEDYGADPSKASEKAKKLILEDKVVAIIGCCMSSTRVAVLPVVEEYENLLIYPTEYEGLESSPNIVYAGAVPNQQLEPLIPYMIKNMGKNVYVIGNDYLYPRSTNAQAMALIKENGGTVMAEEYLPVGHSDFASLISKLKKDKPDVVFSTLVGDSIVAFHKQLAEYGITADVMPVVELGMDESIVQAMGVANAVGHYSGVTYFSTADTKENQTFVENYKKKYNAVPTVFSDAGYISAYLLINALEALDGNYTTNDLIEKIKGSTLDAPSGKVVVNPENNHCSFISRVGKVNDKGLFDIVYESPEPIAADPYAGEAYSK